MKFPKRLRHRGKGKVLATIYKRPDGYRLYWRCRVEGKPRSRMKDFPNYSATKRHGDKVVSDLAKGTAMPLTPGQVSDAIAALEGLQNFYQSTGRRLSLRAAVGDYCEVAGKLHGRTLGEAVTGYLRTVANVGRKDIKEAVEEFLNATAPLSPNVTPGARTLALAHAEDAFTLSNALIAIEPLLVGQRATRAPVPGMKLLAASGST